jgi:hypothetical protein
VRQLGRFDKTIDISALLCVSIEVVRYRSRTMEDVRSEFDWLCWRRLKERCTPKEQVKLATFRYEPEKGGQPLELACIGWWFRLAHFLGLVSGVEVQPPCAVPPCCSDRRFARSQQKLF